MNKYEKKKRALKMVINIFTDQGQNKYRLFILLETNYYISKVHTMQLNILL